MAKQEHDERGGTMSGGNTSPAAASTGEGRPANCRNADNGDLWRWDKLPAGDPAEVNGPLAQEVPEFVPTCAELVVIAQYWRMLR